MFLSIVLYAAAVYFKGGEIAHYGSSLYNPVVEFIHLNSPFKNNFAYYLVILFTNVFILGLESLYFFSVPIIAVVPQAWSLSLELYFYLLAPVLVRQKTGVLMVLFLVSVLWRLFFLKLGYVGDKWFFSFFPFEIAFFVLGIFSYRIYKNNFLKRVPGRFFFAAFVLVLTPIINLPIIENFNFYSNAWNAVAVFLIFFILIVLGLPIIFSYTKNWVVDRWIGEFSYPIYIVHFSVIYFLRCFLGMSNVDPMFGWKVVVFSFVITLVLLYIIVYPIERLRMNRILSHKL
jgi:peptidoglycan/LPS O-acetylase OafA/YrhL